MGHFCPPGSGSGSTGPIESGSNPDPKHWLGQNDFVDPDMVAYGSASSLRYQYISLVDPDPRVPKKFRILIHLIGIRIRVHHFRLNSDLDPDQWFL